jgi:DNA-binding CsgD family transcriptional regulator
MHPPAISEPGPAVRLRGRQVEVETLHGRLRALQAGRGGTVLVTGLAGMGKTVLLEAAEQLARGQGVKVFHGAGDVAAQVIPLGPLLEALMSVPDAPVDRAALRDLSQSPDQRFWLLRELQEGLERAALRAPVLIVLDDVQWADEATLAALVTLTRQLATHRILWLVAVRSGELGAAAHIALSRLEAAGLLKITLGPLDETAVADIAGTLLGGSPDPELMRVLARVQGQPFLLTELLRGLREERLVAVDGGSARLAGTGLPLRFRDSVAYQLARLPAQARDALQMASVLGRRFSADELAALTGAPTAAVFGALREALAAGLVIEDGDRVAFRHDLVREAVDASLPRTVRQSLRRRAVDVMLRHGAPPSDVAELVMDVAQPGDADAIAILRRAAAETGRVSPAVASTLSRRALDLLTPGDPGRGVLTAETLAYLIYAGKAAEAARLMTAAAGDFTDPAAEAEARLSLAHLCMQYSPAEVVVQCRRALELPDVPADLRIQLLSFLSLGLDLLGDAAAARGSARDATDLAQTSGDPGDEVFTLVPRAAQALAGGDWRPALGLAGQAVARRHGVQGTAVRLWLPDAWQALACIVVARLDEAFALIDAGMEAAQRDGISANLRVWSMLRSRALFCSGRLADASAEAEATIEMADEIGDGSYGYINHVSLYLLARVALHTGDPAGLAEARRSAARLGRARESPVSQRLGGWLAALLAEADSTDAPAGRLPVETLDPLADGTLSMTSPRLYADTAALTRVLLDAGRRVDAKSVVARLEDFAALHPDFPFLEAAALHARAVLDRDPDAALRAVELGRADPRPLVRAAALEDAGRLLPDTGAAAVPLLETALGCYAAAGAERDAARVRSLLRARGARPAVGGPRSAPDWPELTESEAAVVALVAQGATNREVADRLYVSPYTVNAHLRHVFTKLGIRSRVELARMTAERGTSAEHRGLYRKSRGSTRGYARMAAARADADGPPRRVRRAAPLGRVGPPRPEPGARGARRGRHRQDRIARLPGRARVRLPGGARVRRPVGDGAALRRAAPAVRTDARPRRRTARPAA